MFGSTEVPNGFSRVDRTVAVYIHTALYMCKWLTIAKDRFGFDSMKIESSRIYFRVPRPLTKTSQYNSTIVAIVQYTRHALFNNPDIYCTLLVPLSVYVCLYR